MKIVVTCSTTALFAQNSKLSKFFKKTEPVPKRVKALVSFYSEHDASVAAVTLSALLCADETPPQEHEQFSNAHYQDVYRTVLDALQHFDVAGGKSEFAREGELLIHASSRQRDGQY